MLNLFDPYQERLRGRNYYRSESTSVPAGGTATVEITGRRGEAYGVLAASVNVEGNERLTSVGWALQDGDEVLFEPVGVTTFNQLFANADYELASPLEIEGGGELVVTFVNDSADPVDVTILTQGLSGTLLDQRKASIRQGAGLGEVPDVSFAYASLTLPGTENGQSFPVQERANLPYGSWVTDHFEAQANYVYIARLSIGNRTLIQRLPYRREGNVKLPHPIAIEGQDQLKVEGRSRTFVDLRYDFLMPLYEQVGTLRQITDAQV